ncbi:MAG: hypothetical protein PHD60_07235 [Clostridia bacterium]|nr:hypothetical protein [Clostridia bacterium]
MSKEEKIFSMMEKMYQELMLVKNDMATKEELMLVKNDMATKEDLILVKENMTTKEEFQKLSQQLTRIENNHGEKLSALLDGYKQNSERLDRIENKVTKHEEVILKQIR